MRYGLSQLIIRQRTLVHQKTREFAVERFSARVVGGVTFLTDRKFGGIGPWIHGECLAGYGLRVVNEDLDLDFAKALLEEHTLMDSEYTDRLHSSDSGKTWSAEYTLDDLEDMLGYIGEGEGHAKDKKIARRLGSLGSRLNKELDSYDDGG